MEKELLAKSPTPEGNPFGASGGIALPPET